MACHLDEIAITAYQHRHKNGISWEKCTAAGYCHATNKQTLLEVEILISATSNGHVYSMWKFAYLLNGLYMTCMGPFPAS